MKATQGSGTHLLLKRISIALLVLALVAAATGCNGAGVNGYVLSIASTEGGR